MDSGKKFVIPKVPKKHVKSPPAKSDRKASEERGKGEYNAITLDALGYFIKWYIIKSKGLVVSIRS